MAPETSSPTETRPPGANLDAPACRDRRSRFLRWLGIALALPLSVAAAFGVDRSRSEGKIARGVEVNGVSLAGLDRVAAERSLGQLIRRVSEQRFTVKCAEESLSVAPAEVGFEADAARTAQAASQAGRTGNLAEDFVWWMARWFSKAPIALAARLEPERLAAFLAERNRKIRDRPYPGTVRAVDGKVVAEYPRRGWVVDRPGAEHAILTALLSEPHAIALPLAQADPELDRAAIERARARAATLLAAPVQLDWRDPEAHLRLEPNDLAAALRSELALLPKPSLELKLDLATLETQLEPLKKLEHEPRDAQFEISPANEVRILASEPGRKLDRNAIAQALLTASSSSSRAAEVGWDRASLPALTTEQAEELGIKQLVSEFATSHPCCQPRVENIHRIADLLNGKVVKPGETFSVNEAIGPRTLARGFVAAPTIEEGEMVDTPGGGISQFATTLYNALFHGGYEILEHQPHTYYFSRYPMGHEATLSYPKPDLVFRNDTPAGLLIRCEYDKSSIRVRLFGDNGGRRVAIKVSSQTDIKHPSVQLFPNRKLRADKEKVRYPGSVGWSVLVKRVVTQADGTQKEEKRKVTYNPRPREVEVHPCRIAKGEPGYTGEPCPVPSDTSEEEEDEPSAEGGNAPAAEDRTDR